MNGSQYAGFTLGVFGAWNSPALGPLFSHGSNPFRLRIEFGNIVRLSGDIVYNGTGLTPGTQALISNDHIPRIATAIRIPCGVADQTSGNLIAFVTSNTGSDLVLVPESGTTISLNASILLEGLTYITG